MSDVYTPPEVWDYDPANGGQFAGSRINSSPIPRPDSTCRTGRCADMIDKGTMIVRDQALTAYKLTGNHLGSSTNSGGTVGHCS